MEAINRFSVERWKGFHTLLSGRSPINIEAHNDPGVGNIIWINSIHISNVSDFSVVCVSLFSVRERSVSRLLSESAGT